MTKTFSQRIITLIKAIPPGKVASYGQIARYAGNPRGARQVAWLLHSSSRKANLPWHRVVNSKGHISLPVGQGYELQKELLEKEGVIFEETGRIDFTRYLHDFELGSEIEEALV
jgi:methylated-DNA-protein-cysteine methyltransferase-like protein